jgi:hypothetical protein
MDSDSTDRNNADSNNADKDSTGNDSTGNDTMNNDNTGNDNVNNEDARTRRRVRDRVRKYGLQSQRGTNYLWTEKQLKENGFVVGKNNKNCLFCSSGRESMKHFVAKAVIFKILRDRSRNVATEVETRNAIVDVLDIDNRIAYEVENGFDEDDIISLISHTELRDIFLIDLKEIPDDIHEAEQFLKQILI